MPALRPWAAVSAAAFSAPAVSLAASSSRADSRSIAAAFLANERASMTAPMKWDRSVTSPIDRASVSAISWSLMLTHTERGT